MHRPGLNLSPKKFQAWGVTAHPGLPRWQFMINHPVRSLSLEPLILSTTVSITAPSKLPTHSRASTSSG